MHTSYITKRLTTLLWHALFLLAILMVIRAIFTLRFVPIAEIEAYRTSFPRVVFNALRFDLQTAAYLLLLPTVLSLGLLATKKHSYQELLHRFCVPYFVIIHLLVVLLSAIDLGFYSNFHSHINITFFDFFNEGPLGLLQAMWEEYHVVIYFLLLIAFGAVSYYTTCRIEHYADKPAKHSSRLRKGVLLFLYITGIAICLRGSVWRFPLQVEDICVSNSKKINDIVPNAVYMLKKAYKEKQHAFRIKSTAELLQTYHFSSLEEALQLYTYGKVNIGNDTLKALHKALFSQVSDTLTHQQPNVLIIYGESWSNYLMELDSKTSDMLFGMRKHLKADLLFRNFQSVRNCTIASIENITVSTPFPRFFASSYRINEQPSSLARPFKESGYSTEFISGMDLGWENCGEALSHQRFDRLTGKYSLLQEHPEYEFNSVGIFDHHLFNTILEHLNTPQDKPQMILSMTTTSHPPFEFPSKMELPPLPAHFYDNPCFAEKNIDVLKKYITGYRYFNQALGRFLDRFKASKAAQNTIVIITGDHNIRSILDYEKIDKRWAYSVPLYIYLPPYLRKKTYKEKTHRWGSHDDILATVAPFAFKHTEYIRLGEDLLCDTLADNRFFSYNEEQVLCTKDCKKEAQRRSDARNLLRTVYFQTIFCKSKSK